MTRRFDPRPIADDLLLELLELARHAPSAGYSQGVHFLAMSGDVLQRFWHTTGGDTWHAGGSNSILAAPVVVLPLADPMAYTSRYSETDKIEHGLHLAENWAVPFWLTDAAMATQNLLLLAEDRGLGALYLGLSTRVREAFDELGIPPHVLQVGAVVLGYRANDDVPSGSARTRPRKPAIEVVHLNAW